MARPTSAEIREQAFAETIRSIPRGRVASYGQVAAAAGYPRYHRAVARLLKEAIPRELPWQRVLGAGGEIKLVGQAAAEQKLRPKDGRREVPGQARRSQTAPTRV